MWPDVFQPLPLPSRGHQQATPSSLDLGSFPFFFFFWLHQAACGTFVPQPGIEPGPQQWKQSPNHWTTREVPLAPFLITSVACAPGVGEAGECECWAEGANWGAQKREAAFDIHAQPAPAHVYCPGSEWADSRRWEEPFYPTDKGGNIAELSSRGMEQLGSPHQILLLHPKPWSHWRSDFLCTSWIPAA